MQNVESIYQQSIRILPIQDQLRLAELIKERAGADSTDRRSAMEILRNLHPAKTARSAAEIDADLRTERDSWDN